MSIDIYLLLASTSISAVVLSFSLYFKLAELPTFRHVMILLALSLLSLTLAFLAIRNILSICPIAMTCIGVILIGLSMMDVESCLLEVKDLRHGKDKLREMSSSTVSELEKLKERMNIELQGEPELLSQRELALLARLYAELSKHVNISKVSLNCFIDIDLEFYDSDGQPILKLRLLPGGATVWWNNEKLSRETVEKILNTLNSLGIPIKTV